MSDNLSQAVESGDQRQALEALRDRLAAEIDETDKPLEVAQLSSRLMECLQKLADLPKGEGQGVVDELGSRRSKRRAGRSAS